MRRKTSPAAERVRLGAACWTIIAIALTLAWLQPAPARSEVRLGNEATGGNYRVSVMSWWEIPFRTVVRQKYDFSCGAAALATLLTFHYGRPTPERETFAAMWELGDKAVIRKVGFSLFEMKTFLNSLGYRAEGFRLTPEQLTQVKRPMIVLLDLKGFKHFVVVKGVSDSQVLVGDSVMGLGQYKLEEFGKLWNGYALAVMEAPGSRRPKYNLAGDWGPWSTAPLESGGIRVAASELTNDLPPDYQITPQILLDVRVGTTK